MAITYPLIPPSVLKTATARWTGKTVVGMNVNPFTGQQQVLASPGTWWEVDITVPACARADADELEGFLLSLRGRLGTFYYSDRLRPRIRGTRSGNTTLAANFTANTSTLKTNWGTGAFSVGDYFRLGNQLFRVTKRNNNDSYEVFPAARTTYASGSVVYYAATADVYGIFRLKQEVPFDAGVGRICGPYTIPLVEVVS